MNILIEKYRGAEIHFDNEREVFSCFLDDYGKESKSFSAVKKGIDDFLKDNHTFEPFYIISKPNSYKSGKVFKVIGIRKDNRFITQDETGKKDQLSEYDEKYYFVYEKGYHDPLYAKVAYLETLVQDAQKNVNEAKNEINGVTVDSIKSNYINP